jgi:nucleoside-diphosphate-sugar epimerase
MEKQKNIEKTRIGITGSTGVLGTRLMEILLLSQADITCLVRENSVIPYDKTNVKLVYGDLNDLHAIQQFISQIDVCIHLAAQVNFTQKKQYYKINVEGTENICKTIVAINSQCRLINCSSIAAYRMNGFFKAQYTDYAKSKRKADDVVEYYQQHHGLKAAIVIPGLIYGPGRNKFIPTVLEYLKGDNVYLVRGGEKAAPLTYVDDLCDLLVKAAMNDKSDGHKYFAFSATSTGIHDFIQMIAEKSSVQLPRLRKFPKSWLMLRAIVSEYIFHLFNISGIPRYPKRMVDILSINFELDEDKRNNNLDWSPKTDPQTGLDNCFKWH